MWMQIKMVAVTAALLAGTTAAAYAQGTMTQDPGKMAPGNLRSDRLGPSTGSNAPGGNGALGAGDAAIGDWTGTNSGVNRRPSGGYPAYGPGYTGSPVAPGGNGALGAGDAATGSWTGTNPGVDRRTTGGYYYGRGGYYYGSGFR